MKAPSARQLGYKHGSQKCRIYQILRKDRRATNSDLRAFTGALRYGARVWEINRDIRKYGWVIAVARIKKGLFQYILKKG